MEEHHMASPPNIFKQSKNPVLNATNTATVGDIWIDLNDAPATIKTLVTAAGVTRWVVKKSEIVGSEVVLTGQTPKSIESDESILFKIGGANRFKISSATVPSGATRLGELLPDGLDSPTSSITWNELSAANVVGEINLTPTAHDAYSRTSVTNFSDESGGGFVFKLAEEPLMSLRPYRIPALSPNFPTPLDGQVVIGNEVPGYNDMSNFNNQYSAKLVVNGNMHIGNSTNSNYISFGGTFADNQGNPHTYIGERLYGGLENSELILFKGNDAHRFGTGPDRIRYIAANHVFQTYPHPTIDTAVQGTFYEIATTSNNLTRMIIDADGAVTVAQTLTVNGSTTLAQALSVLGAAQFDNATVKMTALPTVTALANLYVDGAGRLYKSDSVDFAFESSLSVSGYQKLPSGMIIQWGLLTIPQNGVANATFPIAFNVVFGVVLTSNSGTNTGAASSNYKAVAGVSTTGFQGQSAEGTRGNFWIAFGR